MNNENPFLKQENYFEGYQKSIDDMKYRPELIEFDKLCYSVFKSKDGKKLMEMIVERFLLPGFVDPSAKNPGDAALYFEGFKNAYRILKNCVQSHELRIKSESMKQQGSN